MNKQLGEGLGAVGSYVMSFFALISNMEVLGVLSALAGTILTLSMAAVHYAEYRKKMAEAKAAERQERILEEQDKENEETKTINN